MSKNANTNETYEYKAEMKQLLHLLVHSLYTHPEVFLRELISNASDALNKVRFKTLTDAASAEDELKITITIDEKKKTFAIEDNGIGMTRDELISNIGTVARSGTLEFLKAMKEQKKEGVDDTLIGQFGVGFYSVFMVTDEVTIETRHADGDTAYAWKSSGEGTFTINESARKQQGTKISFVLKESSQEFAAEYKVKEVITKYSNFADFPIYLDKEKVNTVSALWRKKTEDVAENELNEFYKFVTNDFENPLGHLHLDIEGAVVNFKALLFIPAKAPYDLMRVPEGKGLNLYSNKILIQHDCKEVLPEYLRFAKGVVDTIDLPLNVSREVTQASPLMAKIKGILSSKLLGYLQDLAKNDIEKYMTFYNNFGPLLKTGINSDFANRDKIIDLLFFETSREEKGKKVSLKEYVSRMKEEQKDIYYLSGEHRDVLERNPNLEYFKKNGIEVLFLTEPVDVFTVPSIQEYDKKKIVSIDKADIDMKEDSTIEKPDDKLSQSLLSLFKTVLKDKVEDVIESKRLVDSPATLVVGKEGMDAQMEKMMKMMNKDFAGAKKIMEINMTHPLIKNLSRIYIADAASPMLQKCILQMYEGALFIEGSLPSSTDFVARMTEIMQEATK